MAVKKVCDQDLTHSFETPDKSIHKICSSSCYLRRTLVTMAQFIHGMNIHNI